MPRQGKLLLLNVNHLTHFSSQIVMMVISMLSYARNQTCNALQKLSAMYFKYNKISERAFDCLYASAS